MRTTVFCALLSMAGFASGQSGNSKGPPSPAQQTAVIEAVRQYVLGYTKSLPNYTCTLTTREAETQLNGPMMLTNIEEQLTFSGGKEIRTVTRINGRPAAEQTGNRPNGPQQGLSNGEFGNLLDTIFEPASGADIRWDRSAMLDKHKVDVFSYHVPQSAGYLLQASAFLPTGPTRSVTVPFEGFLYADAETHAVLRIQVKCTMIPANFPIQAIDQTLDYSATQVAGREFILPSHFVLHYMYGGPHTNDGRYSSYHQFSADATVQFGGANQ